MQCLFIVFWLYLEGKLLYCCSWATIHFSQGMQWMWRQLLLHICFSYIIYFWIILPKFSYIFLFHFLQPFFQCEVAFAIWHKFVHIDMQASFLILYIYSIGPSLMIDYTVLFIVRYSKQDFLCITSKDDFQAVCPPDKTKIAWQLGNESCNVQSYQHVPHSWFSIFLNYSHKPFLLCIKYI